MRYHEIRTDDMLNGDGLRVVLFLSGCNNYCPECHNPQTWDPNSGYEFDKKAKEELYEKLSKDYISGITLSGGDPLYYGNLEDVLRLIDEIKSDFPQKSIWIYSGTTWEEVFDIKEPKPYEVALKEIILRNCDVWVDGKFEYEKMDLNYPWAGSTNQRVIDIQESLKSKTIILHK